MKVDLHVHSSHSTRPNEWILQKLGTRESYTHPVDVYRIAKTRGMDAVTITDHNTIDGCLELADKPDTFISCEYTTYFPSDGCKVHVLCYNISPEQHEQIQAVRSDLHDLVTFLKQNGIIHALAHPLYAVNERLTSDHLVELLSLFDIFEMNGARDYLANEHLRRILAAARRDHQVIAGSDDHSSLTIARMWTDVPGARTVGEFFEGIQNGAALASGMASTPHSLARHIYSVGYQWLLHTKDQEESPSLIEKYLLPLERQRDVPFVRRLLLNTRRIDPKNWRRTLMMSWLETELARADAGSLPSVPIERQWFYLLDRATTKYFLKVGNKIVDDLTQINVFDLFSGLGVVAAFYPLIAPFFIAFAKHASERRIGRQTLERYGIPPATSMKVAKFTDTFGSVDGVAKTLAEQLAQARRTGKDYTIITCVGNNDTPGLKYFEPAGVFSTPDWTQQKLVWPPLLKMLDYCYEEQFTHIQAATPGPLGLVGMWAAKTLGIPFQAVYHTQIPQFVGKVTEDGYLEELAWRYCTWFYESADVVFAPSEHTKEDLVAHGVSGARIKVYPRAIDTERFHPTKRSQYWEEKWQIPAGAVKALYVGRVSKEKNLPLLVRAFRQAVARHAEQSGNIQPEPLTLLVVGHGAYHLEMQQECKDLPVTFAGELHGEELAIAFASADFFVFPSTTDTYGRVVAEAMASGLPCIVSDLGGPKEMVRKGINGMIVEANNHLALTDAIVSLACARDRQAMAVEARRFTETRSFGQAFERFWSMYAEPTPCKLSG